MAGLLASSRLKDSDGYQGPSWLGNDAGGDVENDQQQNTKGSLHERTDDEDHPLRSSKDDAAPAAADDKKQAGKSASWRSSNPITRCVNAAKNWRDRRKHWPKRCPCHRGFVVLQIFTIGSCCRMLSSQVMPLAFLDLTALQVVLRVYLAVYCVILVLAELELKVPILRTSRGTWGLGTFASRGFLLTFIATVGIVQGSIDEERDAIQRMHNARAQQPGELPGPEFFIALIIQLSSWMMMIVGIIYMLLGAFCMQRVRDRYREEYGRRVERYLRERGDLPPLPSRTIAFEVEK